MDTSQQTNTQLIKNYGTSYYLATLFFPRQMSQDTLELYRFVRIPDQVVDGETQDANQETIAKDLPHHYEKSHKALQKMLMERETAYQNDEKTNLTWGQSVKLFKEKKIPWEYSKSFFDAMLMDTTLHRYKTYKQLQSYMYGSACVVGLMMCHIIGYEEKAKPFAELLGEAMQLSNFLRDIDEDYTMLGRIYMPQDELQKHDLTHDDIIKYTQTKQIDEKFKNYMRAMIVKNRDQYAESMQGLPFLSSQGRKAVYLAAKLYEAILDRIEKHDYNVFAHNCRTTKREKISITISALRKWKKFYSTIKK